MKSTKHNLDNHPEVSNNFSHFISAINNFQNQPFIKDSFPLWARFSQWIRDVIDQNVRRMRNEDLTWIDKDTLFVEIVEHNNVYFIIQYGPFDVKRNLKVSCFHSKPSSRYFSTKNKLFCICSDLSEYSKFAKNTIQLEIFSFSQIIKNVVKNWNYLVDQSAVHNHQSLRLLYEEMSEFNNELLSFILSKIDNRNFPFIRNYNTKEIAISFKKVVNLNLINKNIPNLAYGSDFAYPLNSKSYRYNQYKSKRVRKMKEEKILEILAKIGLRHIKQKSRVKMEDMKFAYKGFLKSMAKGVSYNSGYAFALSVLNGPQDEVDRIFKDKYSPQRIHRYKKKSIQECILNGKKTVIAIRRARREKRSEEMIKIEREIENGKLIRKCKRSV
jgi:hypothetical protein